MSIRCRPMARSWSTWHPTGWVVPWGARPGTGGALTMSALTGSNPAAGPVGPIPGTDKPFMGMDPSDPTTYVRPYQPAAGMVARLNYDGATPNRTQTV